MGCPLVSVVMPTHNYGRFIGKAIESLLSQTYGHFELIITDDASTDSTLEVIEQYADDRIVLVRRTECSHSGSTARNNSLAIARGDLIAVADSDDLSVHSRLESQVAFFEQNPDVDLLGGAIIPIDEAGKSIGDPIQKPVYDQADMYRQAMLKGRHVILHPTMMFRKRVLKKVPGYNDWASSADYEFLLRASRYFKLYNLRDVLVYYRRHPASVTQTYGTLLRERYHKIFMVREYLWVQKEIGRL